jgi:carbonic anhydrase
MHRCDALLIACFDWRIQARVFAWMQSQGYFTYDPMEYPGIVGVISSPAQPEGREFVLQGVSKSLQLHAPRDIVVVSHDDCGAFPVFSSPEEERAYHCEQLHQAAAIIRQRWPEGPAIRLLYLTGTASVLDASTGYLTVEELS